MKVEEVPVQGHIRALTIPRVSYPLSGLAALASTETVPIGTTLH